jgi:imidazolonepropionase
MTDLVVHDASELVVGPAESPTGLVRYEDGALAIDDGDVVAAGSTAEVCREYPTENATRAIDATGKTVLPGFVDPHTHALFAGDRSDEFVSRIEGKTYTEIMDAGGGIAVTVDAIREASDDQLLENLLDQLDVMLEHGTTTAEVKSGYGLDTDSELRMLSVIEQANQQHPVDVVGTFMGAHAIPEAMETDAYVEDVIENQLPAVADQGIATFCDVFCEEGVFDVEQSRRILEAGREYGLEPKLHAEEFTRIGGAQLAADLGATSADHLLSATSEDADALAEADVVPTLLPATAFSLDEQYADAEQFLDAGAPVALGSDLNPSCFVHSMSFVVSLACLEMKMHPDAALRGATANAAAALDRTDGTGTLQPGTAGDFAVFDLPDATHLPYNAGTTRLDTVVKDGAVVVEDGQSCWTEVKTDV